MILSFPRDLPTCENGRRWGTIKLGMMSWGTELPLSLSSLSDMAGSGKAGLFWYSTEGPASELLDDEVLSADSGPERPRKHGVPGSEG